MPGQCRLDLTKKQKKEARTEATLVTEGLTNTVFILLLLNG